MPKCPVPMASCESSQIREFGYDPAAKILAVRFNSKSGPGSVYIYSNVPPDVWQEFQAAESKGKFFGARIKGHADRYPFTRIVEEEADGPSAA